MSVDLQLLIQAHTEKAKGKKEARYLVLLSLTVISCNVGHGAGSLGKQFAFEE